MKITPIAFAFDNNMLLPACVCLSSLMMNAKPDTFYDIFILHSEKENLRKEELNKLPQHYPNCRIQYRTIDSSFDSAYEIRGITVATYYRLLIPELIPEYDKILYSDVDVIFRSDISHYLDIGMCDDYFAGVNALAHLMPHPCRYYESQLKIDPSKIIYAGNLVINAEKIRKDNLLIQFKKLITKKYKYQDMDIINIVCRNRLSYLPPAYCVTNGFLWFVYNRRGVLDSLWGAAVIDDAVKTGIIHYNGPKPWVQYCINFDIWWEYYRHSPYYNEKFCFDFFYNKLEEYDKLSLWKRIKILLRYFVYGRK